MAKIFEFKQCVIILKSTGKKAKNLRELKDVLSSVSEGAITHHTYQYFLKGHVLEYTNDFAHWAGEGIEERALAERLSNIDPYDYPSIQELRSDLISAIDDHLATFPEPRDAMRGDEFHFNETVALVFPAGVRARNLAEFLMAMKYLEGSSLYYHFYDARVRLGNKADDFSQWLEEGMEKPEVARKVRSIDPFMHNLESIRERIVEAVEEEVKRDMESAGVAQ
ncbi:MAG: DUF5752 family protein [Nitrospirota bacterium]|nr:DUF5752 family protein [Nitrospirota bacterium]